LAAADAAFGNPRHVSLAADALALAACSDELDRRRRVDRTIAA
jgi:hypothetical protein